MKVVIDIPEKLYKTVTSDNYYDYQIGLSEIRFGWQDVLIAIRNGTVFDNMVSVKPDENGYYPNVCGICENNESELCNSCEYNSNFKKTTSITSFYKKGNLK